MTSSWSLTLLDVKLSQNNQIEIKEKCFSNLEMNFFAL